MFKYLWSVFFILSLVSYATGQNKTVFVKKITTKGLKKCKKRVVVRQLDFEIGDSLKTEEVTPIFERNQQYLLNTRLFLDAKMNIGEWANDSVEVVIDLKENWYIYPFPYAEYADRNFNAWWVEQNHALNRINLGVRLYHENMTGNADRLKLVSQIGYEQKFEVEYTYPFIGKRQQFGTGFKVLYTRQRETGYATIADSLNFFRSDDEYTLKRLNVEGRLLYQPGLFAKHTFSVGAYGYRIADTIATLNPDFLLDGNTQQSYFSLAYQYELDKRDIRTYALNGFRLLAWVQKDGLGMLGDVNNLFVDVAFAKYTSLNEKMSLEMVSRLRKVFFTDRLPYYRLRRAIGYEENYIRGYEYYVIDGQDFGYLKNSLRFNLFDRDIDLGRYALIKRMKSMPLKVYSKIHSDFAYVVDGFEDSTSLLANDWLFGWGIGIDFVMYHNFVFQLEYSFNHLREKGLYLHFNLGF